MIQRIWDKKVYAIIKMHDEDVCDEAEPLPLLLLLSWNHYIGFYYESIISFFMSYAPFPFNPEQIHLLLEMKQQSQQKQGDNSSAQIQKIELSKEQIVGHLFEKYKLSYQQPIQITCKFRRSEQEKRTVLENIDLKKCYKNNLKASTALRYGKYGAARLTVEMSNRNVQTMYEGFMEDNMHKFLGSYNFQEDQNLGYSFLIQNGDKIPIRILGEDFQLQRAVPKFTILCQFFEQIFGEEYKKMRIKMHGIIIEIYEMKMFELEKYCHPDGFLYLHI